ncbi:hypothetical protein GE061_020217 [Apolygus lucorum]|uniref:Uncharacterized protein n=1 Tax=Apolygus lucorum TaxID=248454 RepID=A0A8S9WI72_APOLU|nr:hypothetical protein GE061_020217 [Apolygus lucorum]
MESLMLTSTFVIDKVKNLQLVVGLSDLTTPLIVIRPQRSPPFYICIADWELLSRQLPQIERKADNTFLHGSYMSATTTPQQHLILAYHPNWLDRLLHTEPHSITLNAKPTSNLVSLISTIDAVLEKMKDLTSGGGGGTLPYYQERSSTTPIIDLGFYEETPSV